MRQKSGPAPLQGVPRCSNTAINCSGLASCRFKRTEKFHWSLRFGRGSLLQPTDMFVFFFLFLVHAYVISQSQAPTIMQECGIARRIIECALVTREAEQLSRLLCARKVLRDITSRFVRL